MLDMLETVVKFISEVSQEHITSCQEKRVNVHLIDKSTLLKKSPASPHLPMSIG